MKAEYKLPADRFAKVITPLTLLVNLLVLLFFIHTELILEPVFTLIAVSILAVPTLTFLLSPVKIVLNDSCLIVKKVVGKKKIEYKSIREVIFLEKPKLFRIFGSGGFFRILRNLQC